MEKKMFGVKFWRMPGFLVLTATLISLNGLVLGNEPRKCYWCGPLAEQVHRSNRAPPCNVSNLYETSCDEGYKHCAVVAMVPPFTESRLCVKLYKTECYTVFCNSTRTWRTICPCRGDLCNGRNTEREIEAFTELRRRVASRTKRHIISENFITGRKFQINNLNATQNTTDIKDLFDVPSTIGKPESLKRDNDAIIDESDIGEAIKIEKSSTMMVDSEVQIESSAPASTAEPSDTTQPSSSIDKQEPNGNDKLPTVPVLQENANPVEKTTEASIETTMQNQQETKMENISAAEPTTLNKQVSKNNTATHIKPIMLTPIAGLMLLFHL
ncbi:uncharacterized protein LOC114243650 [Bombyx mandarina]|uniref:Uncharacterized protein LOC114243650 n=1 Tax=Bombyx mandarina TaxID=7092 RepID=A0A6J2JNB6_BOMMA|nr:uncharacterized protein LOC114243650 [Bombyx mandarina]